MNREEAWAEAKQLERELAKTLSETAKKRRRLKALMHYIRNGED